MFELEMGLRFGLGLGGLDCVFRRALGGLDCVWVV